MKLPLSFITSFLVSSLFCQISIVENIVSFQKNYKPLFSKESSLLAINFTKNYLQNETDTVYKFKVTIFNRTLEETGNSVGIATGSGGGFAVGLSSSFTINKDQKVIEFTKSEFEEFYRNLNKVYVSVGYKYLILETQFSTTLKGLTFAAQYVDKNKPINYFFASDDVIFKIPSYDFLEIIKNFKSVSDIWKLN